MANSLMLGNIKVERTDKGDRRLTHPSGVKVTETVKQLTSRRSALVQSIAAAQKAVVDYGAQAAKETALTPVAAAIGP